MWSEHSAQGVRTYQMSMHLVFFFIRVRVQVITLKEHTNIFKSRKLIKYIFFKSDNVQLLIIMNIITWKYALQDTETAVQRKGSFKNVCACLQDNVRNLLFEHTQLSLDLKLLYFLQYQIWWSNTYFIEFFLKYLVRFTVTRCVPIITANEICMRVICARYLIWCGVDTVRLLEERSISIRVPSPPGVMGPANNKQQGFWMYLTGSCPNIAEIYHSNIMNLSVNPHTPWWLLQVLQDRWGHLLQSHP